jgi:hypothetical protein
VGQPDVKFCKIRQRDLFRIPTLLPRTKIFALPYMTVYTLSHLYVLNLNVFKVFSSYRGLIVLRLRHGYVGEPLFPYRPSFCNK